LPIFGANVERILSKIQNFQVAENTRSMYFLKFKRWLDQRVRNKKRLQERG